jgi:hypothetical protein
MIMKQIGLNSLEAIHGGCGEVAYVISSLGAIASAVTLNPFAMAACYALSAAAYSRCN